MNQGVDQVTVRDTGRSLIHKLEVVQRKLWPDVVFELRGLRLEVVFLHE